jgi:hypothetical protein
MTTNSSAPFLLPTSFLEVGFVLLSDVLGVEIFFLATTASGNGADARFCVTLPPSPPRFFCIRKILQVLNHFFFVGWRSHEEVTVVGTSKIVLVFYPVNCLVR